MSEWTTIAVRRLTAEMLDRLKAEFGVKGKSDVIDRLIEFYFKFRYNDTTKEEERGEKE